MSAKGTLRFRLVEVEYSSTGGVGAGGKVAGKSEGAIGIGTGSVLVVGTGAVDAEADAGTAVGG